MSRKLIALLRRLQAVDACLASPDGLHVPTEAARHCVGDTQIRDDIDVLIAIGATRPQEIPVDAATAVYRYPPHVRSVFARDQTQYDHDSIASLARDGLTVREIAAEVGSSIYTVRNVLRLRGIKAARSSSKVSVNTTEIMRLRAAGLTMEQAATATGVSVGGAIKALKQAGLPTAAGPRPNGACRICGEPTGQSSRGAPRKICGRGECRRESRRRAGAARYDAYREAVE